MVDMPLNQTKPKQSKLDLTRFEMSSTNYKM